MTNHPNRKRLTLEVGKIYLTRDGQRVLIEAETEHKGTYRMQGVYVDGGHYYDPATKAPMGVTWRSKRGAFISHPHRLDLVSEAPTSEK